MSTPTSQADFPPDQTPKFSQQDKLLQSVELQRSRALDSKHANTHQITNPDTRPNPGQNNGQVKHQLADHPEWSAYLADRHILEPAIAAGAWVVLEDGTGQDVLVWREKRRDGSPGATRRRLLTPVRANGKKQAKVRWQFSGQKTDEPFHYVGTLDDLKGAIAAAGGSVTIVEGEFDVWSLHTKGIRNVIGIYGISNIPQDIDAIFDELAVIKFTYYADNDASGERGASNLRTLLHESGWTGEQEYRKFAGPGIPDKGDANDLLCHHFPDTSAARAALAALPKFSPRIQRRPVRKLSTEIDPDRGGWDAVKEVIRIALGIGLDDFNHKGFSKNFHCLNSHHDDKTPSAAWHKDGFYKCFGCGEILNAKEMAERLDIDWGALIRPQPNIFSSQGIDLDAAPQTDAETAPLSFDHVPDSWQRASNRSDTQTAAALFHFALPLCTTGPFAQGFYIDEFIEASRPLGCNLKADTIKKFFKTEVFEDDTHPFFGKVDPSDESRLRNCKFRLRSLDDIKRRLAQRVHYRVYEEKFGEYRDILIGFEVFAEGLPGSIFPKTLKSALEPLYKGQKQRFENLIHSCERIIAGYLADLDDLSATPLPDWTINKPCEMTALQARGIYDADPEDRSKREWAWLLGISVSSVDATLKRAGIERRAYTERQEVSSQREAKDRARELGAKIVGLEVDGSYLPYDAAMDIPQGSKAIFQPPAKHAIVSDEKQIVTAPPAKPSITTPSETASKRADNMRKPGNWHKPSWDPQFIYWELVKACCLLHGYEVIDDIGITDPQTGEVWTNSTLEDLVRLISGEPDVAEPNTG